MEWIYSQPVKLIFGTDKVRSLDKTFADLGLKNGLLVCDPVFVKKRTVFQSNWLFERKPSWNLLGYHAKSYGS